MAIPWISNPAPRLILPEFVGRTAVVSGTSDGLGQSLARLLLDNGCAVWGLDCQSARIHHPAFHPVACDLADADDLTRAFATVTGSVNRLDHLVNVAGADPRMPITELTVERWDRLLDLNLRAYCLLIQAALPWLERGTGRSVVNISSINYRLGLPGRAAYAASKAGILGLTTGLSRELGERGIRINTITPGWIFTPRQVQEYFSTQDTDRHLATIAAHQSLPLQIQPDDIANHILFYLSSYSRASTAHNAVVDAGWLRE